MIRAYAIASIGALILSGCQTSSGQQANSVNLEPVPQNYRHLIVEEVRQSLKDPYSVRSAEISDPAPGFIGLLNGGTQNIICTRFNAKNSFGAYIGIETNIFAFRNGKAIAIGKNMFAGCDQRQYRPFPELERIA